MRTRDYGKTWTNLLKDKKETFGYSLSLVQDPLEKKLLFLGTENGLYVSLNEGSSWTKWTNDYPSVPTMDMVIHPREHDLAIGTFGRSFYVLDDIHPLREIAKNGTEILDRTIKLFEPPMAYRVQYQEPSGTRVGANATFNGENRKKGAMISYMINKEETKNNSQKELKKNTVNDSLILKIYDANNHLIRTLKPAVPKENGLQRLYWNLDEKGVFSPSRNTVTTRVEPSGVKVLPGTYKLVLHFQGLKDSTQIKVAFDPRIEIPYESLKEKHGILKILEEKKDLAFRSVEQLKSSKNTLLAVQKQAKIIAKLPAMFPSNFFTFLFP